MAKAKLYRHVVCKHKLDQRCSPYQGSLLDARWSMPYMMPYRCTFSCFERDQMSAERAYLECACCVLQLVQQNPLSFW